MSDYIVKPLCPGTWDAFAQLAELHNGVWNGCWCTWFHTFHAEKGFTAEGNRALKERLVSEGRAHAALVFDGDKAVAWCEYGTPEELPNIYHRKEYEAMAGVALDGALQLIAQAGGGVVEAYPQDTEGQKVSASFLYNGTRSLFEQAGFSYVRRKGKKHSVMRKVIS
jgi:hypothetical protein